MNDKKKKIVKWSGIGAIALGTAAVYVGGGTEGQSVEIVGAVMAIIGIVMSVVKGK